MRIVGQVRAVTGIQMLAQGLPASIGSLCCVQTRQGRTVKAQVVGFQNGSTVLMPLQQAEGVAAGDRVSSEPAMQYVAVPTRVELATSSITCCSYRDGNRVGRSGLCSKNG